MQPTKLIVRKRFMVAVIESLLSPNIINSVPKGVFIVSDCDKERRDTLEAYLQNNCKVLPSSSHQKRLDNEMIGVRIVNCEGRKIMVLKDIQKMLQDELTRDHFIDTLLETSETMNLPLIITGDHQAKEILFGHDSFKKDFTFIHCSSQTKDA